MVFEPSILYLSKIQITVADNLTQTPDFKEIYRVIVNINATSTIITI